MAPVSRLIVTPRARRDLQAAQSRCRKHYPLNLQRFTATLIHALDELEEFPLRWAIWRQPDLRRKLLPPYPHAIVYHLERNRVVIVAVIDTRQNPDARFPEDP